MAAIQRCDQQHVERTTPNSDQVALWRGGPPQEIVESDKAFVKVSPSPHSDFLLVLSGKS